MPPTGASKRRSLASPGLRIAVLTGGKDAAPPATDGAVARLTLTRHSRTPIAVALGVAALALLGWLVTAAPSTAALRSLPADRRAQLVERTLANLRDVCSGAERPREFCRQQATLVLQLPECDQVCREEARTVLAADSSVR